MHKGTKSRQGCSACKEKKTKCDETRPSCLKCVRSRQPCPGYAQTLRWSEKHEILRSGDDPPRTRHRSRKKIASDRNQIDSANTSSHQNITLTRNNLNEDFGRTSHHRLTDQDSAFHLTSTWGDYDWPAIDPTLPMIDGLIDSASMNFDPHSVTVDSIDDDSGIHTGETITDLVTRAGGTGSEAIELRQPHSNQTTAVLFSRKPETPLTRSMINFDSVLVEYYFANVATLYSCFDGNMNPFRTAIARLWGSSEIMTLTLQSLAAACLTRDFPQFTHQGFKLRNQAIGKIKSNDGTISKDVALLCLIMLGQSASWHHPSDLGLQQYYDAQKLLESEIHTGSSDVLSFGQDLVFLRQAMSYWEMLLSFVSKVNQSHVPEEMSDLSWAIPVQVVPHPWALIAPEMMSIISRMGQLIYSHRKACLQQKFWQASHIAAIQKKITKCREIELSLLNHKLPSEAEIIDPEDSTTPVSHFLAVAKVYQLVAILQIYRVFPDILNERIAANKHFPLLEDILLPVPVEEDQISDFERDCFLRRITLHIIKLLSAIPFESHTRSIQAFLYVAISSELRKPPIENFDLSQLRILEARNLVRSRLEAYRYIFAPKPAQRKLDIVLKVWELMDQSQAPVYWMDVMIENNFEVVFC